MIRTLEMSLSQVLPSRTSFPIGPDREREQSAWWVALDDGFFVCVTYVNRRLTCSCGGTLDDRCPHIMATEARWEVEAAKSGESRPRCVTAGHENDDAAALVTLGDCHPCTGPDGECMGHWYCEDCARDLERGGEEIVHRLAASGGRNLPQKPNKEWF